MVSPSGEEFRRVSGTDYEVSNRGGIRRASTGRALRPWTDSGYAKVDLHGVTRRVHVLVLEAFVGPKPFGMEACHRNDVKLDNRVENLYWGDRQANMLDKVANGNHHNAKKTHCKRGHEFTEENTNYRTQGTWKIRRCRSCAREIARERRAAK